MADAYHHGNLRQQVLEAAALEVAEHGPDALSLRELARQAGVTHGAPAYHFGSRRGVFTALAVDGFRLLANALETSVAGHDFAETAVAYVRFAIGHPGHYAVMFRTELLDETAELRQQRERAYGVLVRGVAALPEGVVTIPARDAQHAAWAIVHGISSLALTGALEGSDPVGLARAGAQQLFGRIPPA